MERITRIEIAGGYVVVRASSGRLYYVKNGKSQVISVDSKRVDIKVIDNVVRLQLWSSGETAIDLDAAGAVIAPEAFDGKVVRARRLRASYLIDVWNSVAR